MSKLSYLIPQVVARFSTLHNRDIRILEEKGKYKLLVNGSRQSGPYIQKLWQHAFTTFGIIPSPDVRSVLVLGVGGGTVIHLLHTLYSHAQITGVDIDDKMIAIGKKYFDLDNITGLSLIQSDAKTFVAHARVDKKKWDMVVVDIFVGATIPPFVAEESFLKDVSAILTPRGTLLINYLREREYMNLSDLLLDKLSTFFHSVKDTEIYFNRFFYCT